MRARNKKSELARQRALSLIKRQLEKGANDDICHTLARIVVVESLEAWGIPERDCRPFDFIVPKAETSLKILDLLSQPPINSHNQELLKTREMLWGYVLSGILEGVYEEDVEIALSLVPRLEKHVLGKFRELFADFALRHIKNVRPRHHGQDYFVKLLRRWNGSLENPLFRQLLHFVARYGEEKEFRELIYFK